MEEEAREREGGRECGNNQCDSYLHIYVCECVFVCQVRANCHLVPAAQTPVAALLSQHAADHHQLFTKGEAQT